MVFAELIRYRESDKGRDKRAGGQAHAHAQRGKESSRFCANSSGEQLERETQRKKPPDGWMILAEEKGKGSRGHRDSIKIEAFGSRAHPPSRRRKQQIPPESTKFPEKITNFLPARAREQRAAEKSGRREREREGRKSPPTYRAAAARSGHGSQRRPPMAMAVLPAESRNSPSAAASTNPGRKGGTAAAREHPTPNGRRGGELLGDRGRRRGLWCCGVGSRTVRRGAGMG